MKSILGVGNALTDILATIHGDAFLEEHNLPKGSMQHVDAEVGNKLWNILKDRGIKYVAGGSAANTISACSIFGMRCGFIGKVGKDDLGSMYKSEQIQSNINSMLMRGKNPSGRSIVMIDDNTKERTFAVYLGAALELGPDDLKEEDFKGYDILHLEGYLVQNQDLFRRAVEIGKSLGMVISVDLASYNVVESNLTFLNDIVKNYINILFANEAEAKAFTGKQPSEALDVLASMVDIAVVKVGKEGSMVRNGNIYHFIEPAPAVAVDTTGAGDLYAAGFLYGYANGAPLDICGEIGSIISSKVVEVVGAKVDIQRWKVAKREIREITNFE